MPSADMASLINEGAKVGHARGHTNVGIFLRDFSDNSDDVKRCVRAEDRSIRGSTRALNASSDATDKEPTLTSSARGSVQRILT